MTELADEFTSLVPTSVSRRNVRFKVAHKAPTDMSAVAIARKVRIQSNFFLRKRAQFRGQGIEFCLDLFKLCIHVCVLTPEGIALLLIVGMYFT